MSFLRILLVLPSIFPLLLSADEHTFPLYMTRLELNIPVNHAIKVDKDEQESLVQNYYAAEYGEHVQIVKQTSHYNPQTNSIVGKVVIIVRPNRPVVLSHTVDRIRVFLFTEAYPYQYDMFEISPDSYSPAEGAASIFYSEKNRNRVAEIVRKFDHKLYMSSILHLRKPVKPKIKLSVDFLGSSDETRELVFYRKYGLRDRSVSPDPLDRAIEKSRISVALEAHQVLDDKQLRTALATDMVELPKNKLNSCEGLLL